MRKLTVLITMLVGVMFNVVANETVVQGKKVAVLPFAVKGNLDALYAEVAQDNFVTELAKSKMYQIVVPSQVDKAMKDLNIQGGNDIDESAAMEIGKITGAEIIVIGGITALNSQFVVNIRGINVNSGTTEFADKRIVNSQGELLVAIEGISKKFAGSQDYAAQDYNNDQNYVNQTPAIDFSVNRNVTLREWEQDFIEKYFLGRWGIDPRDTPKVHKKYKKYLGAGVALCVVFGTLSFPGLIMGIAGLSTAIYYEANKPKEYSLDELLSGAAVDKTYTWSRNLNTAKIVGYTGLAIAAVGSIFGIIGSIPLGTASKIKSIHKIVTGKNSFTPRISTTGGFNGESKLEIALGCNF